MLDVSSGAAKRLVDPAALVPKFEGDRPQAEVRSGHRPGTASRSSRPAPAVVISSDCGCEHGFGAASATPLYADANFSWAPDGSRIAWVGGRSDVSPVDVNVLTVGGSSEAVVKDTNASSVSFGHDGRSVLFANGDATEILSSTYLSICGTAASMALKSLGPKVPGAAPKQLLFGKMPFADVQALSSGAVGFTEWSADQRTKTIQVSDTDRKTHRVAETRGDAPHPIWNDEESVAHRDSRGSAATRSASGRRGDDRRRWCGGVRLGHLHRRVGRRAGPVRPRSAHGSQLKKYSSSSEVS